MKKSEQVSEKTPTANRQYKDTVFRMLFSEKENLLSLYNAVTGNAYQNADDLKIEASVNYADIEGFPVSTVKGHKGRFVFAHVEGVPVVIMQGRVHYYEGYPMSDVVLPTRLMGLLGAKKIILTNAAGGVNYNFKPGDFMLITDHITTAVPNPLIGENIDELGTRFPDMSEVYAPELQEKVRKAAEKLQIPLQEGVYMQFTGPSYETPAEIRMCRTWGGDAVRLHLLHPYPTLIQ